MKYIGAVIFGILSFILTVALYDVIKGLIHIPWLYSSCSLIWVIAFWNAVINARAFLWVYYDFEKFDKFKEEIYSGKIQGVCWIHFDKYFRVVEQFRHFIFNFIGMMIGWVSLFALMYRLGNFPKDIGAIDLGLAVLMLLGISGNLPWISTRVTNFR